MKIENFVFYKAWADELDNMDDSARNDFAWRIIEYGIFGREHFDGLDHFAIAWLKDIYRQIDAAKHRYDNKIAVGKNARGDGDATNKAVQELLDNGVTKGTEIAKRLGLDKSTIYKTQAWMNRGENSSKKDELGEFSSAKVNLDENSSTNSSWDF